MYVFLEASANFVTALGGAYMAYRFGRRVWLLHKARQMDRAASATQERPR
jgi:hypothetical protein